MVDGFKKSQLIMTIEMHCYTKKKTLWINIDNSVRTSIYVVKQGWQHP